jgi:hypothetical protein
MKYIYEKLEIDGVSNGAGAAHRDDVIFCLGCLVIVP